MNDLIDRVMRVVDIVQRSRPGRALARYSTARGGLLAGGIAYTGLFSIFGALAIGISLFMATLGSHEKLRTAVFDAIEDYLPGMVDTGHGGLVTVDQLTVSSALNPASIIGTATLLLAAMSLMGALRTGLRSMFGIITLPQNPLLAQLLNFVGFLVMASGVLLTAAASLLTGDLARTLGMPEIFSGWGIRALSLASAFLVDAGVFALLLRISGLRIPRRDLLWGAGIAAVSFGVLRQLGTEAVGGAATRNPLLASFAAIIVLVLWLHLASRVVLMVAAWMANPPRPVPVTHPDEVHANECPNYVTVSVPETLTWPRQPLSGSLELDPTAHPEYIPPTPLSQREDDADAPSQPSRLRRLWRRVWRRPATPSPSSADASQDQTDSTHSQGDQS